MITIVMSFIGGFAVGSAIMLVGVAVGRRIERNKSSYSYRSDV